MITKELLDKEYYYIRDLDKLTSPKSLTEYKVLRFRIFSKRLFLSLLF
jgi:hypothetical protein